MLGHRAIGTDGHRSAKSAAAATLRSVCSGTWRARFGSGGGARHRRCVGAQLALASIHDRADAALGGLAGPDAGGSSEHDAGGGPSLRLLLGLGPSVGVRNRNGEAAGSAFLSGIRTRSTTHRDAERRSAQLPTGGRLPAVGRWDACPDFSNATRPPLARSRASRRHRANRRRSTRCWSRSSCRVRSATIAHACGALDGSW